jgi:FkbM family methyltransferase
VKGLVKLLTPFAARQWVRRRIVDMGIDRGVVIRRLAARLGHPRLRELWLADPWWARPVRRWLSSGPMSVPPGTLGGGLLLDMKGIPLSHAHLGSLAYGNLEQSVQEAMLRHLGHGGVFYDIGANIGFFALLAGHMSGYGVGHVYAFEPTPDNAAEIRSNVVLNGLPNVEVVEKAVGAEHGTAQLQVVDDQSWSKLVAAGEHPFTERVMDIEVVAIDDLVADGFKPPTVVKIDVEGFELPVLEGMRKTIAEHKPVIICELHDTHVEFVEFMDEVGYRVVNLEGPASILEQGASAHALALPPGNFGD